MEAISLLAGLAALVMVPSILWIWRYLRAWWAGTASAVTLLSAALTAFALVYGPGHAKATASAAALSLGLLVAAEYWRQNSPLLLREPRLGIPTRRLTIADESGWEPSTSDDPISDWDQDIIGRTAIVETLADHALRLGTPIVALHGGLGDGKTSVLNLLRKTLEGKAIVVSFSAWLPGSEATLARDILNDIATECRRHVYVPQLRRRVLAYARTVTGSVSYLAGVKEILPTQSQHEEIDELRQTLARVPLRIVVLLDEIDRMQKDELLVLLKILRGSASLPNVTFVCAFSPEEIRQELSLGRSLSYEYLEKFFPVTVNLSQPNPDVLGNVFQRALREGLGRQNWFRTASSQAQFAQLLEQLWQDSLCRVCTNLRKLSLLLNDILTAARPIVGEVNALDLTVVETLRRFYPEVYSRIRENQLFLTYARSNWSKGRYFVEEEKKKGTSKFIEDLEKKIGESNEPEAARAMLSWIFPDYAGKFRGDKFFHALARPTKEEIASDEKRICDSDYFPIYFRGSVPTDMFSNAELSELIKELNDATSDAAVESVFSQVLNAIPPKHPKREDLLWKLGRAADELNSVAAERLACSAAARAADYSYDIFNVGEAARALNLVFIAAQKLAKTPQAQRTLLGAMKNAADDTFAIRLLEYTELKNRNRILVDYSNVNIAELREAFFERMRHRYGPNAILQEAKIAQGDWRAFRAWADNSSEDATAEQQFWRRFIGTSRKKLAQAINFIYPGGGVVWSEDPVPIINRLFPTEELAALLQNLPQDEQLDEVEARGIERFQALLNGDYPRVGQI